MTDRTASWRRPQGRRPWVLGHRGARHAAPENTLEAFELARHEGADGVELDVRLSSDREIVVFHDRTLERVTNRRNRRPVDRMELAELQSLDLGSGARVPRLAEVLDWAAVHGQRLNIELKHDTRELATLVRGVARLLGAHPGAPQRVLVSSFHPGVVFTLARMAPDVPACWLVHAGQRVLRNAPGWQRLGAAGVHPEWRIATAPRLERWRRAGALLGAWTVNDPEVAKRLSAQGVDTIISDTPGAILEAVR